MQVPNILERISNSISWDVKENDRRKAATWTRGLPKKTLGLHLDSSYPCCGQQVSELVGRGISFWKIGRSDRHSFSLRWRLFSEARSLLSIIDNQAVEVQGQASLRLS